MPSSNVLPQVQAPQILQNPSQLFTSIAVSYLPYQLTSSNPLQPTGSGPNGWNPAFLSSAFSTNPATMQAALVSYIENNFTPTSYTSASNGVAYIALTGTTGSNAGITYVSSSGTQTQTAANAVLTLASDAQLAFNLSWIPGTPAYNSVTGMNNFVQSLINSGISPSNLFGASQSLGGWITAQTWSDLGINGANLQVIQSPSDYGAAGTLLNWGSLGTFGSFITQTSNQNIQIDPDAVPVLGSGVAPLLVLGGQFSLSPIGSHMSPTGRNPVEFDLFSGAAIALQALGQSIPVDPGAAVAKAQTFGFTLVGTAAAPMPVWNTTVNGTQYVTSTFGGIVGGIPTISTADVAAVAAGGSFSNPALATEAAQQVGDMKSGASAVAGIEGLMDFGNNLGSQIGEMIAGNNLFEQVALGTLLGALGSMFAANVGEDLSQALKTQGDAVAATFGQQLGTSFGTTGISIISSQLTNEILGAAGEQGFGGQLTSVVLNTAIDNVITTEVNSFFKLSLPGGGNLASAEISSLASFFGQELGQLVVSPTTQAGADLAALGSTIGGYLGSGFGPIGTAIGSFIGDVIGTLLGNLFGAQKPVIPTATAAVVLQLPYAQYAIGATTQTNGGNLGLILQIATTAQQTLNGIMYTVVGASGMVANTTSPTQTYGLNGSQLYVTLNGTTTNESSTVACVDTGVLGAIRATELVGGDIFAKRAIDNSTAANVTGLMNDLQYALDYNNYRNNWTTINQVIALSPNSAFAAGWVVTFQRANELNLDQWAPSDFYGGVQGFLQSFNINGSNFGSGPFYENISLSMSGGALTIGLPAADTGVFSILPQASSTGSWVTIANFGTAIGYSTPAYNSIIVTDPPGAAMPGISSNLSGNAYVDASASTGTVVLSDVTSAYSFVVQTQGGPKTISAPESYHAGDVIMIGGSGTDTFYAGAGNDWMQGGAGTDTFYGGTGNDVIIAGGGSNTITAGSGTTYIYSGAGTSTINLGSGNDTVALGSGLAHIVGGSGNDTIITNPGANPSDTFWAASGNYTLSYARWTSGVNVNLNNITGYQNIIGSNYNDVLTGGSQNAVITAGAGNDTLNGGSANNTFVLGSGVSTINGAGLSNTLSYANSTSAVDVNLATGAAFGGYATGDVFSNIQNLTGSNYNDILEGNSGANVITTGSGNSDIIATEGADTYIGGAGFDTVDYSQSGFLSSGATQGVKVAIGANNTGTVVYRNSDGTTGTQNLSAISEIIGAGPSSTDVYSSTSNSNMTWDSAGATATFNNAGGTGSDTYLFGLGYHNITINDSSAGSNTIEMKPGVTFAMLWAYNNNGALEMGIRGQSGQITVNSDIVQNNNVIKTLEVSGGDTVSLYQVPGGNILTTAGQSLAVSYKTSAMVFAYYGGDTINTTSGGISQYGSVIAPDASGDTITTGAGNDQFLFEYGDGHQVVTDDGGQNTVVFGPTVAATDVIYQVVGANLYIGLENLSNTAQTASQVPDYLEIINGGVQYKNASTGALSYNTLFSTEAAGTTVNLATLTNFGWDQVSGSGGTVDPIVFDLTGKGLELTPVASSNIITKDGNGVLTRMGWVGPDDGILVATKNSNGPVNSIADISFIGDVPGATNDLQGLAAFDTNHDGVINAQDADFNQLKIWVDANQDGQVEAGELYALAQLGVTSISLNGAPTGQSGWDTADSYADQSTTFTYANGTTGTAYDVALARQFLSQSNAGNAPDVSWTQLTSNATIGELLNNPVTAAQAAQVAQRSQTQSLTQLATLAGPLTASLADQYAQTSFNGSNTPLSAAAAAQWAAANAPQTPTTYTASQLAAIEAPAVGIDTVTGRGAGPVTRLQGLVVDYAGQGASLIDPSQSPILVDANNTGADDRIGWIGASEGFLVADPSQSQSLSVTANVSFLSAKPGALTDIQALSAFDTNGDGVINASDTGYSELGVWRDFNQNGVSDTGEYRTLAQAGVAQISLDPFNQQTSNGTTTGNQVQGEIQMTLTNGTVLDIYDTALGELQPTNNVNTPMSTPTNLASSQAASNLTSTATSTGGSAATPTASAPGATTTASANASAGGVTSSLLGEDGPEGETVSATATSPVSNTVQGWWVNTASGPWEITLQGTLQSFTAALQQAATPLSNDVIATGGTDAAAIQRQQLLRQSLAAFQGGAGGTTALTTAQSAQAVAAIVAASTGSNSLTPSANTSSAALAA